MAVSHFVTKLPNNRSLFVKRYSKLLKARPPVSDVLRNSMLCRVCLNEGNIPVLEGEADFDVAEALFYFGNIKIAQGDTLPKRLCKLCFQFLNIAVLFRNVALQTSDILTQQTSTSDIPNANNKKNELEYDDSFPYNDLANQDQTKDFIMDVDNKDSILKDTENDFKGNNKCLEVSTLSDNNSKDCIVYDKILRNKNEPKRKQFDKVKCEICKKVVTRTYYKYHKTMHDPNHKFYQCDICGKAFRLRCAYYNHSLRHRNDFPYKCNHCAYQGKYKELLKAHLRIHTQEMNFMCTECPAKFRCGSNLNKHMLQHKIPQIQCDRCSKAFHSKQALQQHVDVYHLCIRNHICDECGKTFGYRRGLVKHQNKVHKRKKLVSGRMPAYLKAQPTAD